MKTNNQTGEYPLPGLPLDVISDAALLLFVLWSGRVATIRVKMDPSHWVDSALTGLGYDRLRHAQLTVSPSCRDNSNAASRFDGARKAFGEHLDSDWSSACR